MASASGDRPRKLPSKARILTDRKERIRLSKNAARREARKSKKRKK